MKKYIFIMSVLALVTVPVLNSCSSPADKVENAENDVHNAKEMLAKANLELEANIQAFRVEMKARVDENNRSIAAFKVRIENERADQKALRLKKISELEERNKSNYRRMSEYKGEGNENWEIFKKEFSHDMNELGEALSDLTVNNVK